MKSEVLPRGIYSNCTSTFFVLENDYVFIVPNDLILQQMQTKFLSNKTANDFAKEYEQKGSYSYIMQVFLYQLPIAFFRNGYLGQMQKDVLDLLRKKWHDLLS